MTSLREDNIIELINDIYSIVNEEELLTSPQSELYSFTMNSFGISDIHNYDSDSDDSDIPEYNDYSPWINNILTNRLELDGYDSDDEESNDLSTSEDILPDLSHILTNHMSLSHYNIIVERQNIELNINHESSIYRSIFQRIFNRQKNIKPLILSNTIESNEKECNICMDILDNEKLYKCKYCTFVTHLTCNETAIKAIISGERKCVHCSHKYE